MTADSLGQKQIPTLKLSSKTLDNYAAAAGQKYLKMCDRIKQKVKSTPVLNKIVHNVKAWDEKMTQKHGAAYKFAKGAVIGTAIGVGLAVAGPEVAAAYAAINAARAAGTLLAEAEKARQEGNVSGFSDFAAKNKTAVGLAALSVGVSAMGVSAGAIEGQTAAVISGIRQVAVGGMMATATASKIHKVNADLKAGKITEEAAKQAKKEHWADLGGKLAGLAAVSSISSQMHTNAETNNQMPDQTQPQTPDPTPAPAQTYDGGTLPEVVVTAPAPEPTPAPTLESTPAPAPTPAPTQTYDGGTLPEVVVTAQAPERVPLPEAPVISRPDLPPLQPLPEIQPPQPEPVLPEIRTPADQRPINVEKDTFVSYTQKVSPTTNTFSLNIADNDHISNDYDSSSLFVEVQDIKGSDAKLMSMSVHNDNQYSDIPTMHIDADGKVTELPDWHAMPDANGDSHLSDSEIRNWAAKRQASLQSVLSEQEARNVVMTELSEEAKLYNGKNICTIESEQNSGTTKYSGPADGLNKGGENAAARVRDIGSQQVDKIANSAREVMCDRIDTQGNERQVSATEKQIQTADQLLRSIADRVKSRGG